MLYGLYLCMYLACLAVSLYPINVKTAKPIGSTFFVETQGLRTVIRKKNFPGKKSLLLENEEKSSIVFHASNIYSRYYNYVFILIYGKDLMQGKLFQMCVRIFCTAVYCHWALM